MVFVVLSLGNACQDNAERRTDRMLPALHVLLPRYNVSLAHPVTQCSQSKFSASCEVAILARTAVSSWGVPAETSSGSGINPASHAIPCDLAGTETSGELSSEVHVERVALTLQALR